MSRPHINTAPVIVKRTYEEWLGSEASDPRAWLAAANYAFSCGFACDPPATPTLKELDRLRAAGDTIGTARLYRTRATQLADERHARNYYDSLAGWRATKPAASKPVANTDLPAMLERAGANAEAHGSSVAFKSNSSTREASK